MNKKIGSRYGNVCCGMFAILLAVSLLPTSVNAQDSLMRIRSDGRVTRLSGKIQAITPLEVTFNGRSGPEAIPVWDIEKLSTGGEPAEVERARDRIESGRYNDALEELASATANDEITKAEIAFYKALASSKIALGGGNVTAKSAASDMNRFLKSHPQSHHLIPATEIMGKLAIAAGELDFAAQQFSLLTKSNWPEFALRGSFQVGQVQLLQEKYTAAISSFDKLIASEGTDDVTQRYKLLARCEKAKAGAMNGDPAASVAELKAIIQAEDPDDKELFAHAYNALGTCYLKLNDLAEAQEKFLFTHLLFDSEVDPHAEAVYQLAKIWTQENQTDRATEAREILKTRYRNSWWSSRLN